MTVESAIRQILLTHEPLVELIDKRIFPHKQGVLKGNMPGITYQRTGRDKDHTNDGASGFAVISLQLTVASLNYAEVKTIVTMLEDLLDGFKGAVLGVNIQAIFWDDDNETDDGASDPEQLTYEWEIDLSIQATEPKPTLPVEGSEVQSPT